MRAVTIVPGQSSSSSLGIVARTVTKPVVASSPTGTYVYVVEDEVTVTRQVEVSRSTADEMVIRSGLSGGETVVTDGHLLLTDRTPVRVVDR